MFSLCSLCLCGESAFAHPIPNTNHDRTIKINLTRDGVTVDYALEVAPETAAQELTRGRDRPALRFHRLLPGLSQAPEGRPRRQPRRQARRQVARRSPASAATPMTNDQHLHLPLHRPLGAGIRIGRTISRFRDANYELDDFSGLRLTLTADDSLTLENVVAPDEALMARPGGERKPGDGERLRTASGPTSA